MERGRFEKIKRAMNIQIFIVLGVVILIIGFFCAKTEAESPKVKKGPAGIKMILIKGGCFKMGDNFGDGDSDEKPVHKVCVDDFYLSETEVTQSQWEKIMDDNPSVFEGANRPVENVNWDDVKEFLSSLNDRTGEKYRLPTEAEWEYAARERGKRVRYATGKNKLSHNDANYSGEGGRDKWDKTSPVKSFHPNSLGLYDMAGNVWEWCNDWYDKDYYENCPKNNPKGPSSGDLRVLRGGSWDEESDVINASGRGGYQSDSEIWLSGVGFRLAQ